MTFDHNKQQVFQNIKNFIMRGCKLKNTKWVTAQIVYTGNDTKVMQNA